MYVDSYTIHMPQMPKKPTDCLTAVMMDVTQAVHLQPFGYE